MSTKVGTTTIIHFTVNLKIEIKGHSYLLHLYQRRPKGPFPYFKKGKKSKSDMEWQLTSTEESENQGHKN